MTDQLLPQAASIAAICNGHSTFYDVIFEPKPNPTQLAVVLERLYATFEGNTRISSGFVFTPAKTLSVVTHDAEEGDEQFSVYKTLCELFQPSLPHSAVVTFAAQIKRSLATLGFMLAGPDPDERERLFRLLADHHLVADAQMEDGVLDLTVKAQLENEACRHAVATMFEELGVKIEIPEHRGARAFGMLLG
ncbi:MAG TPA: hypothetical protein VFO38_03870 [Candidatus Saccharimonadales bacterium]|nr:hypothetical protein [Candidatus Saccharimonadales bacterium]